MNGGKGARHIVRRAAGTLAMPPRFGKAWARRRSPVGCRHMRMAAPDLGSFRRGKITAAQQPFLAAGPGFRPAPPCQPLAGPLSHFRPRYVAVAKRSEGDLQAWDPPRRHPLIPPRPHLLPPIINSTGSDRPPTTPQSPPLLSKPTS